MINLIKRTSLTAVKLPFAALWDVMSLGNMGDGSSTVKVLQEHKARKYVDDILEIHQKVGKIK